MKKLILIAQTSLEGFVAGPKGEFDHFIGDDENLEFVCGITETADAALFGRVSYQLLEAHWPNAARKPGASKNEIQYSNWYNRVPKYVLSKTLTSGSDNTIIINDNIAPAIKKIKETGDSDKNILVFGSPTALDSLLEMDLLDGIWLIMHPVLFGEGIPLFKDRKMVTKLNLVATKHLQSGTICMNYLK